MKELDSFTVERLEELSVEEDLYNFPPTQEELNSLARIALAAKRAEPVGYLCEWDNGNQVIYYGEAGNALDDDWSSQPSVYKNLPIYTTPQLNSPEIPEDWKLVPIIAYPSQWAAGQKAHNNAGINKVDAVYKAMVAAAPNTSGFDPSLPGAEATVITHYHTPDGYKLVPTEITRAMRDAWDSAPNGHEDDDVNMCNAYRAMIAAAPEKLL